MRELTIGKNLTAGATATVYTVPKGCKAIIRLLFLTNSGALSALISAAWYDTSATTSVTIVGGGSVIAGGFLQLSDSRIVMDEYDELRVTPVAGSTFSVILTVELHQNAAYQN